MEHCIDHDVDSSNLVKHRVGKAPKESSSHRGVDQLIRLGTAADRRDARPDSGEKIGCEPGALRLVPAVSFVKIELSLRREPKPLHFRRLSLVRTSAQDFAADGFRACARRRRASSLRCASVTGIASGVSARLSQISSSRRRRSATLSERISVRTVLMAAFSASRSGAASLMSVRITAMLSGEGRASRARRPLQHAVIRLFRRRRHNRTACVRLSPCGSRAWRPPSDRRHGHEC